MRTILFLTFLLLGARVYGQYQKNLNNNWQFSKSGEEYTSVQLPHTWNAVDPFDDEPGYYRGNGYYTRKLYVSENEITKTLYLRFEAVNQHATVKINGQKAGEHKGGYTAFYVNITDFVKVGENEITVEVDNYHNPSTVPLKGDFNFYGGIYRDVWLEVENDVHYSKNTDLGFERVQFTGYEVSPESAELWIDRHITFTKAERTIIEEFNLYTPSGKLVSSEFLPYSPQAGATYKHTVNKPVLWSPDSPGLYRIKLRLIDAETKEVLDSFEGHYGFRFFRFDANTGFHLNGKPLKLIGANRHQDYPGLGNALTNDRHRKDIKLLKDMGANFFRTAHYPQDRAILDACDSLGLLVSMEIPLDHEMTDSPEFRERTRHMMKEMMQQYHNHPSIIIWAYMNEMFLGRQLERDQKDIQTITDFAQEMENFTRNKNTDRYTMIPNHGAFDLYHEAGLIQIPMLVGWNLYFGWYEDDPENLTRFLNNYHDKVPDKPVIITEYGAGADPRIRSLNPERFDFSVDWQFQYHLSYLNQFRKLDFLSGAAVWNLFDFGSEFRQDAVPHINSKGLMTHDRQPKDSYYLYKARLTQEPFAGILPTLFPVLPQSLDDEPLYWPIRVVSNLNEASIKINGFAYPSRKLKDGFAEWQVPLIGDSLHILANASDEENEVSLEKSYQLSDALNINLGANFYFHDPQSGDLWRPDQEFHTGKGFGYTGGEAFRPRNAGIGVSRGIQNTEVDPLYQTQLQGLTSYRISLPPGEYTVKLLWANIDPKMKSRFELFINGEKLDEMNSEYMPEFKALFNSYSCIHHSGELLIELKPLIGKTFLNGIQIIPRQK